MLGNGLRNEMADPGKVKKICMVAGWGRYPVYVAKSLKAQGFEVHCFGVVGHADKKALSDICDVYRPVGMCRLGRSFSICGNTVSVILSHSESTSNGGFFGRLHFTCICLTGLLFGRLPLTLSRSETTARMTHSCSQWYGFLKNSV